MNILPFRNSSSHSLSKLEDLSPENLLKSEEGEAVDTSPSLDLLLQVQRLLVSRIFPRDSDSVAVGLESGELCWLCESMV